MAESISDMRRTGTGAGRNLSLDTPDNVVRFKGQFRPYALYYPGRPGTFMLQVCTRECYLFALV